MISPNKHYTSIFVSRFSCFVFKAFCFGRKHSSSCFVSRLIHSIASPQSRNSSFESTGFSSNTHKTLPAICWFYSIFDLFPPILIFFHTNLHLNQKNGNFIWFPRTLLCIPSTLAGNSFPINKSSFPEFFFFQIRVEALTSSSIIFHFSQSIPTKNPLLAFQSSNKPTK